MRLTETHLSAGQIDPDEYRAILLANLNDLSDLTDEGVTATLDLFAELQRDVRRTIMDIATPPTKALYNEALNSINQSIANFGRRYGLTLTDLQARGFDIGAAIAIDPLGTAALAGLEGIARLVPPEIAALFQRFSADLIQGVTQQIRTRINTEVIGVLAGAKTPQEAAQAIGRNLTDPNHFTSVAARARAITVTEIGRASAVGTQGAQQDLARQIGDDPDLDIKVQKRWINAHLPGARPEHLAAERRYHPDGSVGPIPIDEPYRIAGFTALYPRDPSLPAAQSVNCHCQSITWIPEMMEADPLAGHQAEIDDALELG